MSEYEEVYISLVIEDGDEEELNSLTFQLKAEIEQIDIETVEFVSGGEAPEGSKALDITTIGAMIVTIAKSKIPSVIPNLVSMINKWIERKPTVPVKIKIRLGKSKEAQIEFDPTKTSVEELSNLIKTLSHSLKK